MWFSHNNGQIKEVAVPNIKINSQQPAGQISINDQKSGWVAMSADGRVFDEAHHEWSIVPKDIILDIRMMISDANIAIPKLDMFTKFIYIRRGDGKFVGAGAMIGAEHAMYILSLNTREGCVFAIDKIKDIELLPYVDKIEYVEFSQVKENIISIELPSHMIVIPRRHENNYFFQYKDGAIQIGGPPRLFGQVMGMTTNRIGNCLVLFYDQIDNKCLVSVDNIFNMKMSTVAQGFPVGVLTNPITGKTV